MQPTLRPKGITLLELMLVLAIVSSIMVLTLKTYKQYQNNAYAEQIKYNVDTLLQAMTEYYRAQCSTSGTLGSALTTAPYPLTLTLLKDYLPNNWKNKNPRIKSYEIQFNPQVQTTPVSMLTCDVVTPGTACTLSSIPIPITQAVMISWNPQVALETANMSQDQTNAYKILLNADCISTKGGAGVKPCATVQAAIDTAKTKVTTTTTTINSVSPTCGTTSVTAQCVTLRNTLAADQAALTTATTGAYLVWQRSPSVSGRDAHSSLWMTTPALQQFNLQYTHDQMLELQEGYTQPQNYRCGG